MGLRLYPENMKLQAAASVYALEQENDRLRNILLLIHTIESDKSQAGSAWSAWLDIMDCHVQILNAMIAANQIIKTQFRALRREASRAPCILIEEDLLQQKQLLEEQIRLYRMEQYRLRQTRARFLAGSGTESESAGRFDRQLYRIGTAEDIAGRLLEKVRARLELLYDIEKRSAKLFDAEAMAVPQGLYEAAARGLSAVNDAWSERGSRYFTEGFRRFWMPEISAGIGSTLAGQFGLSPVESAARNRSAVPDALLAEAICTVRTPEDRSLVECLVHRRYGDIGLIDPGGLSGGMRRILASCQHEMARAGSVTGDYAEWRQLLNGILSAQDHPDTEYFGYRYLLILQSETGQMYESMRALALADPDETGGVRELYLEEGNLLVKEMALAGTLAALSGDASVYGPLLRADPLRGMQSGPDGTRMESRLQAVRLTNLSDAPSGYALRLEYRTEYVQAGMGEELYKSAGTGFAGGQYTGAEAAGRQYADTETAGGQYADAEAAVGQYAGTEAAGGKYADAEAAYGLYEARGVSAAQVSNHVTEVRVETFSREGIGSQDVFAFQKKMQELAEEREQVKLRTVAELPLQAAEYLPVPWKTVVKNSKKAAEVISEIAETGSIGKSGQKALQAASAAAGRQPVIRNGLSVMSSMLAYRQEMQRLDAAVQSAKQSQSIRDLGTVLTWRAEVPAARLYGDSPGGAAQRPGGVMQVRNGKAVQGRGSGVFAGRNSNAVQDPDRGVMQGQTGAGMYSLRTLDNLQYLENRGIEQYMTERLQIPSQDAASLCEKLRKEIVSDGAAENPMLTHFLEGGGDIREFEPELYSDARARLMRAYDRIRMRDGAADPLLREELDLTADFLKAYS